eukprot:CAMPEP_0172744488 /NCGR_PEP_ID=MMETSP1074-20121228/135333_1 /TAXON_ID=2916 /ORGANISM="Ceratium fusus, Strain PA161109" /LENGTH=48 /DNA_ID= /DNA_START= /DNA_END= /DNA_ORIENTATION=
MALARVPSGGDGVVLMTEGACPYLVSISGSDLAAAMTTRPGDVAGHSG